MSTPHPPIPIYTGNIPNVVIHDAYQEVRRSVPLKLHDREVKKDGRGITEAVEMVFTNEVAVGFIAAVIFRLSQQVWGESEKLFSIHPPKVIVKFKTLGKMTFFKGETKKEVEKALIDGLEKDEIEFLSYQ